MSNNTPQLRQSTTPTVSGAGHVILLDVSSSMGENAGTRPRIAHLRESLRQVATPAHTLLAFATEVTRMASPEELPPPLGGTALHLALAEAAKLNPAVTLVITDGEPNDSRLAVAAAGRLRGRIDTIFCGNPTNLAAISFCRLLARMGGGQCVIHSWHQALPLASTMRLLLGGPKS
jgi:hypothetical protein